MPDCPSCRYANPPGSLSCERCGDPLPRPASDAPRPAAEFEAELLALLRQGKKIPAIKQYREHTGVGLKEAKDAVEALAARHNIAAGGCAGRVGVLLIAAVG